MFSSPVNVQKWYKTSIGYVFQLICLHLLVYFCSKLFTDFILKVPRDRLVRQKLYCLIEIIHSDLFSQLGKKQVLPVSIYFLSDVLVKWNTWQSASNMIKVVLLNWGIVQSQGRLNLLKCSTIGTISTTVLFTFLLFLLCRQTCFHSSYG